MYSDGKEELYDRRKDPNEFTNLAGDPKLVSVKQNLAKFAPKTSAAPVPEVTAYDFDFKSYTYKLKGAK